MSIDPSEASTVPYDPDSSLSLSASVGVSGNSGSNDNSGESAPNGSGPESQQQQLLTKESDNSNSTQSLNHSGSVRTSQSTGTGYHGDVDERNSQESKEPKTPEDGSGHDSSYSIPGSEKPDSELTHSQQLERAHSRFADPGSFVGSQGSQQSIRGNVDFSFRRTLSNYDGSPNTQLDTYHNDSRKRPYPKETSLQRTYTSGSAPDMRLEAKEDENLKRSNSFDKKRQKEFRSTLRDLAEGFKPKNMSDTEIRLAQIKRPRPSDYNAGFKKTSRGKMRDQFHSNNNNSQPETESSSSPSFGSSSSFLHGLVGDTTDETQGTDGTQERHRENDIHSPLHYEGSPPSENQEEGSPVLPDQGPPRTDSGTSFDEADDSPDRNEKRAIYSLHPERRRKQPYTQPDPQYEIDSDTLESEYACSVDGDEDAEQMSVTDEDMIENEIREEPPLYLYRRNYDQTNTLPRPLSTLSAASGSSLSSSSSNSSNAKDDHPRHNDRLDHSDDDDEADDGHAREGSPEMDLSGEYFASLENNTEDGDDDNVPPSQQDREEETQQSRQHAPSNQSPDDTRQHINSPTPPSETASQRKSSSSQNTQTMLSPRRSVRQRRRDGISDKVFLSRLIEPKEKYNKYEKYIDKRGWRAQNLHDCTICVVPRADRHSVTSRCAQLMGKDIVAASWLDECMENGRNDGYDFRHKADNLEEIRAIRDTGIYFSKALGFGSDDIEQIRQGPLSGVKMIFNIDNVTTKNIGVIKDQCGLESKKIMGQHDITHRI
ncbi:hypothetical protein BDA99DRAFT_540625 [Phascolomyces articulosus]|uniref:BRCT domain-containing protein n=1 Tax=Phascolomyces articulosus TaxID=60185 RepID=A0AAD5PC52_9FUNG|nr:hypothetical protein BDA99DRAFT_540625 [Phascolomyces articulosus]